MRQNFKRWYYSIIIDPALPLMLPFLPLYLLGLLMQCTPLWLVACLAILVLAVWQRCCSINIGRNFRVLPALPGGYRTMGQRSQKGVRSQTCRELRQSLLQDSRDAAIEIPAGKYQTITHAVVLRRLERSERISVESAVPIYMGTLRPILLSQTHKRCRRCKARCSAWSAPMRQFYMVRFTAYDEA